MARNTSAILMEESHVARVTDPAGGSWYVESLTAELARKAWAVFQQTEAAGGIVSGLKDGSVAARLAASAGAAQVRLAKRKDAEVPVVLPCTLLPYDPAFEMGNTLERASRAEGGMFDRGAVKLCHKHCAKFCVLGGGSCS